jgi:hypothetical protein
VNKKKMDSAIRELINEDSSDSQDSIISVSSSVSSASFVSSVGSPQRLTSIQAEKRLSVTTSPQKRLSSPTQQKHTPKKAKLELIEELRSVINSTDSDTVKVQKAKQLFETHSKNI